MHRLKHFLRPASTTHLRLFSTHQIPLQDAGPMATRLTTRSVIRFKGPDTVRFLQGLVTNDVQRLVEPSGENRSTIASTNMPVVSIPPLYTALLTPQGRFLYDLFLYRPPREGQMLDRTGAGPGSDTGEMELYADVDASVLDELLETLKKYRLRSKVDIENVGQNFTCWQRFGQSLAERSSSTEEPEAASVGWAATDDRSGQSSAHGNGHGWQWYMDPRLECLGLRGIFPSDITPPLVEADKETQEEYFLLWRLEKGVAEGSEEMPKGEAIPLEYNLAGLNAISFDKGCYVGQELVARTHHRGVIRKRLLPLRFVDNHGKEVQKKVAPGSEVVDSDSGKKAGTITTALGCRGLGLLRLEDAFKEPGALIIKDQGDVKVEAIKPEWWPSEWTLGYQQKSAAA